MSLLCIYNKMSFKSKMDAGWLIILLLVLWLLHSFFPPLLGCSLRHAAEGTSYKCPIYLPLSHLLSAH